MVVYVAVRPFINIEFFRRATRPLMLGEEASAAKYPVPDNQKNSTPTS
jgi:hypothetical protein